MTILVIGVIATSCNDMRATALRPQILHLLIRTKTIIIQIIILLRMRMRNMRLNPRTMRIPTCLPITSIINQMAE